MTRAGAAGILLGLILPVFAMGEEPTAKDLVDKARERSALNLAGARAKLRFHVVEGSGATRDRIFSSAAKKIGGRMHSVLRFSEPAEVAGIALRVVERSGEDPEQLLYLPKIKRVRKIASGQKQQTFLATDPTYADLGGAGIVEGVYEKLPREKVEGQETFVLEGKPSGESTYGKVKVFIHDTLFLTLRAEFFDKEGKLLKTYRVKRLKEVERNRYVAMESVVESVQGGRTEITVLSLELSAALSDEEFSERALER
jgi:hypothetical protein